MKRLTRLLEAHPALWRASALAGVSSPSVASGFAPLDRELPGGGWPAGALTELLFDHPGSGEIALLAPALGRLAQAGRWIGWINPPFPPYAPALAQAGIDPARMLVVSPPAPATAPSRTRRRRNAETPSDLLWSIEQTLRAGVCGAVLAWPHTLSYAQARRLQLAAEKSDALAILLRPAAAAREASPAVLRVALTPVAGGAVDLAIVKRRGYACDASIRLGLPRHGLTAPALAGSAITLAHAVDRARPARAVAGGVPPGELVS